MFTVVFSKKGKEFSYTYILYMYIYIYRESIVDLQLCADSCYTAKQFIYAYM